MIGLGLHALSDPIAFVLDVCMEDENTIAQVLTLDYGLVRRSQITGEPNEKRMKEVRDCILEKQSAGGLKEIMEQRALVFKETLRYTEAEIHPLEENKGAEDDSNDEQFYPISQVSFNQKNA